MDDLNVAGAYADKLRVATIFDDLDKLSARFAVQLREALFGKDHTHDDLHLLTKLQGEILIFALHVIGRIEFWPLGSAREEYLYNALYNEVEESGSAWLWDFVNKHHDMRVQQYAQNTTLYIGLGKTEPSDVPLMMKFAEVVAGTYSVSTPKTIGAVAKIGSAVFHDVRRHLSQPSLAVGQ